MVTVDMSNTNWINIGIWTLSLSPIWGALVWGIWQGVIRPALIPRNDINIAVGRLMARDDGQGFEIACLEEHAAWYRSECFEQGRWRRVRKEIMRREREHGATFRRVLR